MKLLTKAIICERCSGKMILFNVKSHVSMFRFRSFVYIWVCKAFSIHQITLFKNSRISQIGMSIYSFFTCLLNETLPLIRYDVVTPLHRQYIGRVKFFRYYGAANLKDNGIIG